ncbi:MAG: diguanylate cyclase [Deltaproteobacteria bacterium]|nr:diguanylate cyclase [Deltaproteobacteria bacterium]MBW1923815.1 diguanylate cyclase [Deltaproteobacteria bacterium]MBW1948532.1 diguanylate cyclase [Deltaproteobacteria bacterium]MBW2006960.1 diguanylate cyclase [Deltaproteobacteria bacterium]MBW2347551.1 diguanylate cyclase [Deltaproteobacteria bacterium]
MHSYPILIAEDNQVSRRMLQIALTKAGYEVTVAQDGREALDMFNDRFFPIVLTDWMMPEMDGLALCRAIREAPAEGYVFIILLTAKDSKEDIVAGLEAGADDYLTKPVNHAELIARIKTGVRILELERSLKKANEEIRILSVTDPLTGCYNRGYLMDRLPQEVKKARRYGRPLTLIMGDIDHFKRVNDTYGHQAGDRVLKEFATRIRNSFRAEVDWLARYGGEEFIVVAPDTHFRGGCILAERLRQVIEENPIPLPAEEVRITASFGITCLDPKTAEDEITAEILVNLADQYLYQAKEEGRNRVCGNPL